MPCAPIYKIAVVQLHPRPMQMADNYSRAERYIREAAAAGAVLVALPEYCLTGWCPQDAAWADAAEDRSYLRKFCELAKELHINIVPGTFVEKHTDADGREVLYNNAYFIDHNGDILGQYTKKNLWHPERPHLESPPSPHALIQTPLGPVGLLICWDLAFPESFRSLISQGANIIIIPTFWTLNDVTAAGAARNPDSEEVFLRATLVSRAFENECVVVFANAGGRRERGYAGSSMVAMPFLGVVKEAQGTGEQVVIAECDMEILNEAEENYKIREDLRKEDFHYPVPPAPAPVPAPKSKI